MIKKVPVPSGDTEKNDVSAFWWPANALSNKVAVKKDGLIYFIETDHIYWIEAENQYVKIHSTEKSCLIRESLTNLEKRLDPTRFYRCHRSAIINIQHIKAIEPSVKGDAMIHLNNGTSIKLSRTRKKGLKEVMKW